MPGTGASLPMSRFSPRCATASDHQSSIRSDDSGTPDADNHSSKKTALHDRRQAMSGHPLLRCTVYTVIAVFAMSACGERTGPLEPTLSRLETSPASARGDSHAKILKRSKALKGDLQATATVTPNGGTLAIPDAGL